MSFYIPSSVHEWVMVVCIVVLLIALFMYNKAIMNCRSLISEYVREIKDKDKLLIVNGIDPHTEVTDDFGPVEVEVNEND